MRRIYLASSWRNARQPELVRILRADGHEVYDFRNPRPGEHGFAWSSIDPDWMSWDGARFRAALDHPIAVAGFKSDHDAMEWADTCVLLLPCGRSAHLEAGEFIGARKRLYILLDGTNEPELMYRGATRICLTVDEMLEHLVRGIGSTPFTEDPFKAAGVESTEGSTGSDR